MKKLLQSALMFLVVTGTSMATALAVESDKLPGSITFSKGSYTGCRVESAGNVGYVSNNTSVTYPVYMSYDGIPTLKFEAKRYGDGTITVTFTDEATSTVELTQTITIDNTWSGSYTAVEFNLSSVVSKGEKTMKLAFATSNSYLLNFQNMSVDVQATGDNLTYYKTSVSQNLAEAGTATQSPAGDSIVAGTQVIFSAVPNFGYHFVKWVDADNQEVSTEANYVVELDKDMSLQAIFEQVNTYSLEVESAFPQLITFSPAYTMVDGKMMYEEGTEVTITASSNRVVTFASWSTGATSNAITLVMDQNQSVSAEFATGDFLAAWDLHDTSKSQPYTADFYSSEDNEKAGLYLRNFQTGQVDSHGPWFRGYQAVNWGDEIYYAYEVNLNTTNFTELSVECNLWYSYNYWEKVQAQWSYDAETWTNVGDPITMTSSSKTYSWTLPAECEHQSKLLFRLLPDVTSTVLNEGASTYRPIWISDVYVFGKGAVYDDGVAPVLTNIVPAEGATGASATGRIALTFDEKVQLTDATLATLTSASSEVLQLVGTATGTIVTFPYTGLNYNTAYTFSLAGGSVADQGGNAIADDIKVSFTTLERPAVAKKGFDFVIGVDGTADEAFAAANAQNSDRFRIFVPNGEYKLEGNDGSTTLYNLTYVNQTVSIIGQDRDSAILYNDPRDGYGISQCSTIDFNKGNDNYVQDVTLENRRGVDGGQAAALHESTQRNIYKHARIKGNQDTYVSGDREYFEDCDIIGSVDFICGGGNIWFEQCDLRISRSGSVLTAPNTVASTQWGYVFNQCTVDCYDGLVYDVNGKTSRCEAGDGSYNLGRPWQNSPASTFLYTNMQILCGSAGWQAMSSDKVCRFHEYGSVDKNGKTVDLSTRSISSLSPAEGSDNPVLTAEQAAAYTLSAVLSCESDGWIPGLYTEQCVAPVVTADGATLTWADDPYASCYVIFCDNVYVGNVTTNSFVTTAAGTYTVRSANERGGLGEASAPVVVEATGIGQLSAPAASGVLYNVSGQRVVRASQPGLYLLNGRKLLYR